MHGAKHDQTEGRRLELGQPLSGGKGRNMQADQQDRTTEGRWRLRAFLAFAAACATLAAALPSSAHNRTVTGTIVTQQVSIESQYSVDWPAFVAGGCNDHTTAVQVAFVNVQAFRGHRATVKVTGSAAGSLGDRRLTVTTGIINCQDPSRWQTPSGYKGQVTANAPLTFTVPSNAYFIAILGGDGPASGQPAAQTFEVSLVHI